VVASINKNTIKQVSEVDAVIQQVKLAFNEMSKVRTVRRAFRVKIQDEVAC
jgi:flagellin-specific chaperone FliS